MKIVITMNVDEEYAAPGHPMGVTEAGYNALTDALASLGENIEVEAS